MTWYRKILDWQWLHNSLATETVRIFLGVALLIRGCLLWIDPTPINQFLEETSLPGLLQYITFAHVVGGLLLMIGLFTRIAALIQIPVLTGAVFVVHLREGLVSPQQSLELAGLVLFLLLVYFAFGPGKLSLDYRFFGRKEIETAE